MWICGPLQIFLDSQHCYLQKAKENGKNMNALTSTECGLNVLGNDHAGPGQGRRSKRGINMGETWGRKEDVEKICPFL